jgi:hypothetical protein
MGHHQGDAAEASSRTHQQHKQHRGPGRPRKDGDAPRKRGRPRKNPRPEHASSNDVNDNANAKEHNTKDAANNNGNSDGEFSSENEFYSEEDEEEDDDMEDGEMPEDDSSPNHQHAKHHQHHSHQQQQHHPHHNDQKKKEDKAANKIQLHWKKGKHDPVPTATTTSTGTGTESATAKSSAEDDENESSSFHNPTAGRLSPKALKKKSEKTVTSSGTETAIHSSSTKTATNTTSGTTSSGNNKKTSRNKKGDEDTGFSSGKTKTVPAPSVQVLEWMRNLTIKRARRNVAPGMRVKVRFATKIKREGKVVRKKKWFGGRVSAVSKEGSKIRIKYDDSTAEVTKFPDKDIVVDDTFNGQHQAPVDKFLPPEPQSDDNGNDDAEGNGKKQEQAVATELAGIPADMAASIASSHFVGGKELQNEEPSTAKPVEPAPSTTVVPAEKALDGKESHAEEDTAEPRKQVPVSVESKQPSWGSEAGKGVKSVESLTPENSPKPKKKRGRPPKHRPVIEDSPSVASPSVAAWQEGATKDRETVDEGTAYEDSIQAPIQKETEETEPVPSKEDTVDPLVAKGRDDDGVSKTMPRQQSKLSLTIRIPARKKEDQQQSKASLSPRKPDDEDMGDESAKEKPSVVETERLQGEPVKSPKSKKRSLEEAGGETTEQPSKRLHIHIPSSKASHEAKESKVVANYEQEHVANPSPRSWGESQPKVQGPVVSTIHKVKEAEAESSKAPSVSLKSSEASKGPSPPPSSLPSKKMRRKSLEATESGKSSESATKPENESSFQLPKASKPNKAEVSSGPSIASTAMREEDITANLTRSTNSAFESQEVVASASAIPLGSAEGTPHGRSKQEVSTVVRSGRRAAQQANERIVSRQEVVTQDPVGKKKRKKEKRRDGEHDDSDDSDDAQWVQCDSCSKWRIIPGRVVATLPKQWYCADNTYDSKRSSCDAPEQTPKQVAKEKRKKKRQRLILEAAAAVEAAGAKESGQSEAPKGMPVERPRDKPAESVKPSQPSLVQAPLDGDSGSDTLQKAEKKSSGTGLGKKAKSQESLTGTIPEGEVKGGKPRGRPRRSGGPNNGSENAPAFGGTSKHPDEAENLEWVQCEKCDKWRKLPPHVSADELPDVWYCNMNTWNPPSSSCDAPEDRAEGLQDTGVFGVSGSNAGKLSYRNLIFGSNGRKANRPVSERTRASESLFGTPDDDDAPPTVMYANSSAFVSRSKSAFMEETEEMSVLDLMSHSNLWAELRGIAQPSAVTSGGIAVKPQRTPFYSFDSLPSPKKEALKDLLLYSLDSKTLTGHEVLLEVQSRQWENVQESWVEVRAFCSIDVVITALCELVKECRVDCVQSLGPNWTVKDWNPRYCRAKGLGADKDVLPKTANANQSSRCMKIAKPWKRARIQ